MAKSTNLQQLRMNNEYDVFKSVQQHDGVTRAAIASSLGLTRAAVTKLTSELLQNKFILELRDNESGKKAIPLHIDDNTYRIIGIHVGRRSIKGAVMSLGGKMVHRNEEVYDHLADFDDSLPRRVISIIRELINSCYLTSEKILGIGVSAPGPINREINETRIIIEPDPRQSQAPYNWEQLQLERRIEETFGLHVWTENDSNLCALAEKWFGIGKGKNDFVSYCIGLGIGAGVIMGGNLLRGHGDVFCEIGHTTINADGPQCECGNYGCLELYGSFKNLLHQYYVMKNFNTDTIRNKSVSKLLSEIQFIFNNAEKGDEVSKKVIQKQCEYLGIGIVTLANMFSPEFIVVTPNEVEPISMDLMVDELKKYLVKRSFPVLGKIVEIVPSSLGDNIHLLGCCALVIEEYMKNKVLGQI